MKTEPLSEINNILSRINIKNNKGYIENKVNIERNPLMELNLNQINLVQKN